MTRKVALISGASRGIGAAIARTLARMDCDVVLTCVNRRVAAEALAGELRELGGKVWVTQFDVKDGVQSKAAIEGVLAETEIHIVVNNAGVAADAPFPGLSKDAWHSVIDTSLDGFFHVTQPLVMPMVRRRSGGASSTSRASRACTATAGR
jgi:3-oxoacyl-[acyl-carrier protein] reductase